MKDRIEGPEGRRAFGKGRPLVACVLLGLALSALPAAGQGQPGQTHWQTPPDHRGLPSENTAVLLSAVGTTAAVLSFFGSYRLGYMTFVPLFAGPSLGAIYGGLWGRALLFIGIRVAGTFALAAAAYDDDAGIGLGYAWVGGMALTAIIEIATVGGAVRKRNDRRLAQRGLKVEAAPFALPKGGGVQVRLSF